MTIRRYHDVIEQQAKLYDLCQHPGALELLWGMVPFENGKPISPQDAFRRADAHIDPDVRELLLTALGSGNPYFVTSHTADLIASASQSLPFDARLHYTDFLTPTGFMLFERPLPLVPRVTLEDTVEQSDLVGYAWLRLPEHVVILVLVAGEKGELPNPRGCFQWVFGETLAQAIERFDTTTTRIQSQPAKPWHAAIREIRTPNLERAYQMMVYAACTFSFLSQQIVTARTQQIDRHARKRLARLNIVGRGVQAHDQVHVVYLRRVLEAGDEPAHAQEHIEHAYRWWTRGHWRNQYYASSKQHRTIWIMPFIKGPQDKPIKPPPDLVFVASR